MSAQLIMLPVYPDQTEYIIEDPPVIPPDDNEVSSDV
jgi:hypothetical protein